MTRVTHGARLAALLLPCALLASACAADTDSAASASGSGPPSPSAAAGTQNATEQEPPGSLPPVAADFSWPQADPPAGHYPVTVRSCGREVSFSAAPERAVVNDDNMVEMMFALGLTDRMAAYAASYPRLRPAAFSDDYAAVDYLGDEYFSLEPLLGAEPDFVFAGWNYGFDAGGINPDSLAELQVPSYELTESCRRIDETLEPSTVEDIYTDIRNLAAIFGVPRRAEALIAHWEQRLDRVAERIPDAAEPVPAFSYGFGTDAPGGGLGLTIVPELYRLAGARNVFEDLKKMWGPVSWEAFVDSRPEIVVVTDYGGSAAADKGAAKIDFLRTVDGVDTVPAVANDRFLVLPQEAVNPGIRFIDGIEALAAELYPEEFADLAGTDGFGLMPTYDAS